MGTAVVLLIVLALAFGGVSLLVEGLSWLLGIALVLLVIGFLIGASSRGRVGRT